MSDLTITLRMMSNNRRSVSSIDFVHVRFILKYVGMLLPDEENDSDVTCWMYSLLASSIGKWQLITGANLQLLLIIRSVSA